MHYAFAQKEQVAPQTNKLQSAKWDHVLGTFVSFDIKSGKIYCDWNPDCLCFSVEGNVIIIHEPCDELQPINRLASLKKAEPVTNITSYTIDSNCIITFKKADTK